MLQGFDIPRSGGAVPSNARRALVELAGRPFRIRRDFLADAAEQNLREKVIHLGRALLILHSPVE